MTAVIDGKPFAADSSAGFLTAIQFEPARGGYILVGVMPSVSGLGTSLGLTFGNIEGPGTYPLGVDGVSVTGGFGTLTDSAGNAWSSPFSGASGTLTITTLTATRIAGTFSYAADSLSGHATGTRVITSGDFDMPFQSNSPVAALPDSVGATMIATVGGTPWRPAIISAGAFNNTLSVTGINDFQTIIFAIAPPTVPGTYALDNLPGHQLLAWDPVSGLSGPRCCWGISTDTGILTVTSVTTTRIQGTFSATLSPQSGTSASGPLVVSNGSFDIGLFHNP